MINSASTFLDKPLLFAAVIASVGLIVARLEDLACIKDFSNKGLLSWPVYKYRYGISASGIVGKILNFFFHQKHYRLVLFSNILSSLIIFLGLWNRDIFILGITLALLTCILVITRCTYGLDGSDQMTIIVLSSVLIGSIGGEGSLAYKAATWFITLQLVLSYFVSGIYKFSSPIWRSGLAIQNILWLDGYGAKWAYAIVGESRILALINCWFVMSWELFFPTIFFTGYVGFLVFLSIGLLFHMGCAVIMGLNNFLFAFLACYPCLIWCIARVISF
jgi:hypothetical protein